MLCNSCGAQMPATAHFCASCGNTFDTKPPVSEPNLPEDTGLPQPANLPPLQTESLARRHMRALLAVLLSLILVTMLMNWVTVRINMWDMADEVLPTLFEGYLLQEVQQVVGGIGQVEYTISVSDIPNFITTFTVVVDLIEREGTRSWGIPYSDVNNFRQAVNPLINFADTINISGIVIAVIGILMFVSIYLIVSGSRGASVFAQISTAFTTLMSLAFAIILNFANSILRDSLGGYIIVSVSVWVYIALGLSVIAFVIATLSRGFLRV